MVTRYAENPLALAVAPDGRVTYLALGNAFDSAGSAGFPVPAGFTGRTAIAGTAYPRSADGRPFALPEPYRGTLLMTEWTRDILASVSMTADDGLDAVRRILPWERFRRPIDLEVGPDGALYVLEFGTGLSGDSGDAQLSRIEYDATGNLPSIAEVRVGNSPPTVRIVEPVDGATFRDGDTISLAGEVADVEDEEAGGIPCSRWIWDIRLGHNAHSHPVAVVEGCTASFRAGLGNHDPSGALFDVVELRYTDRGAPGAGALTGRAQIRIVPER